MTLEEKVRPAHVIHRSPAPEALAAIREGKKFIVVENGFPHDAIPLGYMLIDTRYRGESLSTLVPQQLLFFLANPGEGGVDDALDEISDFYREIEDDEDDRLEENGTSVQGTNWAVSARNAYNTYLINKLTRGTPGAADAPAWNPDTLAALDLADEYVARRVRAIAALCLGRTQETDLRTYNLGDVVHHVTVNERRTENLSREEFERVTCWAGSHYDIKEEFKRDQNVEYKIDHRHDTGHKVGKKITKQQEVAVLDATVAGLEREIEERRREIHGALGRHDRNLIRAYANITYIAPENPLRQLETKPPSEGWPRGEGR